MTYCFAFTFKKSAYLISDSALTVPGKPRVLTSSYGQAQTEIPGGYFVEGGLKTSVLPESAAVAFSGDASTGWSLSRALVLPNDCSTSIRERLRTAILSLGPFESSRHVDLLFAAVFDGVPEVAHWSTRDYKLNVASNIIASIGSLPEAYVDLLQNTIYLRASQDIDEDHYLPYACALLQAQTVTENLQQAGIGGHFVGVRVTAEGVRWQQDTITVIYDDSNLEEISIVQAAIRDGVLTVHSSITQEVRSFANEFTPPSLQNWTQRRLPELHRLFLSDRFSVWNFISNRTKLVTVLYRQSLDRPSEYVRLNFEKLGKFRLDINERLRAHLCRALPAMGPNDYPAHLRFIVE